MVLALIGMSGIGKTAWARRLAAHGFACLHCDDLIAERLRAHADIASGSLRDVGQWMGLPYEAHYAEREALYLAHEAAVLHTIAAHVAERGAPGGKLVIDLTGSAVYVAPATFAALRRVASVVYLAADAAQHPQMLQAYLAQPRPVVWNGVYQPRPGESRAAALARCYPQLLAQRAALYTALSDVRLPPSTHGDPATSVEVFLWQVETQTNAKS